MKRAPLLAAILLLALVPHAGAVGAEPRPWAPYNAVSDVVAIALAREGTTIAAALGPARTTTATPQGPSEGPGQPCNKLGPGDPGLGVPPPRTPSGPCTDLAVLQYDTGWVLNATMQAETMLGRTHVAVARDGSAVASLGLDGAAAGGSPTYRVHYIRAIADNWTATAPYERDVALPAGARPVGVAISDDGRRVAALTAEAGSYVLRGYAFGSALQPAFEARAPGAPYALAAAGDLSRLLVAGQFPEINSTFGGAYILPFAQAEPMSSYFDRSANNTNVSSGAMSRDGQTVVLGGADGRVLLFQGGTLGTPQPLALGTTPIANLTMSEDGTRAAASLGLALHALDISAGPRALWNTTLGGQNVTGLAMNRTGALLVVGTSGTGGGVWGFDEGRGTPLWSLPGDTRAVAVDSDGTRVAYGHKSAVGAARLPRLLTMELAEGGKLAPQRTIALPGNTTYEVSLRNDGAATERVVFEEGAPEVSVVTTPSILAVRPGDILRANVTIVVDQPLPGPRVFNLTARSLSSGIVDNVTLSIAPRPTLDVKLTLNDTDVIAQPGKTSTVLLTIVNNGTSDSSVGLRATQTTSAGPAWDLTISETSLTALRGTRTAVKVLVTPPETVANGTSSTVRFTLEGQDVFDTASITFRVNPDLKVDVNATGVTKFIEPGKRGYYNVTVTNTGSLPRNFDVFYTIIESSGRSWAVDMQADAPRLDPLQKRVFPVTIIAPADAQPSDRVSVMVTARSIPEQVNETAVIDNETLYGVAVPLKIPTPTTTPRGIPLPGPFVLLALISTAAVLLRRRP